MGSRDRSDSRWEVVMAGFNLNERNERTWNKDWIILVGKSLSTLCHIRHVADSLGLQDDGKGWFWLVAGQNPGGSQSPWPVGFCPNQKAYPAYPVSTCNRCSFYDYGGFGCLWRIWKIWSVLALHFASGHGLDFGLVPRPLSLRHEITSLWVSPGSLKGRHNMTQRDTQRETRCESWDVLRCGHVTMCLGCGSWQTNWQNWSKLARIICINIK